MAQAYEFDVYAFNQDKTKHKLGHASNLSQANPVSGHVLVNATQVDNLIFVTVQVYSISGATTYNISAANSGLPPITSEYWHGQYIYVPGYGSANNVLEMHRDGSIKIVASTDTYFSFVYPA